MLNTTIKGDNNVVKNYYQQPLPAEKRTQRQTIVFTESEEKEVSEIATHQGYSQLSPFLRDMVFKGIQFSKFENLTLTDILR